MTSVHGRHAERLNRLKAEFRAILTRKREELLQADMKTREKLRADIARELLDELVGLGLVSKRDAAQYARLQSKRRKSLATVLLCETDLDEKGLAHAISARFGLPLVSVPDTIIPKDVLTEAEEVVTRHYQMLPIFRADGTLTVAMADPVNSAALEVLRLHAKSALKPVVAVASEVSEAIERNYDYYRGELLEERYAHFGGDALPRRLVEVGRITRAQLQECLIFHEASTGRTMAEVLVEKEIISEQDLAATLSDVLGIPLVDVGEMDIPESVYQLVPEFLARSLLVLPISVSEKVLTVATADPLNQSIYEALKGLLPKLEACRIEPVVAVQSALLKAIHKHYRGGQTSEQDAPATVERFNGPSDELRATQVLATLDTPVPGGANAIWCASFQSAWKAFEEAVGGGVLLDGSPMVAALLNDAPDPRPEIPGNTLYTAAGSVQEGVIERIGRELKEQFPGKESPSFQEAVSDAFIVYSYLQANVAFKLPYFQSREALTFTAASGKKVDVSAFGIRPEDEYSYYRLRDQPHILFRSGESMESGLKDSSLEFAIDLCAHSSPSQIVVARIAREATLARAVERVEDETKASAKRMRNAFVTGHYPEGLGPNDVLLVPDILWRITHRFADLEGRRLENESLAGWPLAVVRQDIEFRLDRNGAELLSECEMMAMPVPTYYVFDRPFLVYMKKRHAKMPYFAMWVDNAELLSPSKAKGHAFERPVTKVLDDPEQVRRLLEGKNPEPSRVERIVILVLKVVAAALGILLLSGIARLCIWLFQEVVSRL